MLSSDTGDHAVSGVCEIWTQKQNKVPKIYFKQGKASAPTITKPTPASQEEMQKLHMVTVDKNRGKKTNKEEPDQRQKIRPGAGRKVPTAGQSKNRTGRQAENRAEVTV